MHLRMSRILSVCLSLSVLPVAACSVGCATARGTDRVSGPGQWTFDDDAPQRCPASWKIAATNPTAAMATWQVFADPSAPSQPHVFGLTKTDNYDGTFNLAIAEGTSFRDLDLTVKVKAVAGREDQGGGPIWRCQDQNNYYICRLNPLESNFRVYVVKDGKRRQLDSYKVDLAADRWYTIRITMTGDQIKCYLDGQHCLSATDASLPRAGMVGLWTKADAVTSFDDLHVAGGA